jgi:hypothetical protein
MILPHTEPAALPVRRRVAAFSGMTSDDRLAITVLITRDANGNGIIRLTFTA